MAYPFCLVKWLVRRGLVKYWPSLTRGIDVDATYLRHCSDRALTSLCQTAAGGLTLPEPACHDIIDLGHGTPLFDGLLSSTSKLPVERRGVPPAAGLPELQDAVADKLRDDYALSFRAADQVLVTAGVSGAFQNVLDAFVNAGDRVVLFDPSSYLYAFALKQRRARIRWVPTWLEDGTTCFHPEALQLALRGAKLIVVNSPASPTGGVLAIETQELLAWWAKRHDVLIFSDDVYERYQYDGTRISIAEIPDATARTLLAGSVSKSHALASARVGWLAGPRDLLRVCTLTASSPVVPTLVQQLAILALRQDAAAGRPIYDEFAARRHQVHEQLLALGLEADWPAGAFYSWVPVGLLGLTGREFASQLLYEEQVLVWPGELFGPNGSQHIRLSYAGDADRLNEGLQRLGAFVRRLAGRIRNHQRTLEAQRLEENQAA